MLLVFNVMEKNITTKNTAKFVSINLHELIQLISILKNSLQRNILPKLKQNYLLKSTIR